MLIAHVKAHLVTGETVDLLPVRHETDVKKEVTELLEGWASSGFLIWEKCVYPWHQVRTIEVAVESLSSSEADFHFASPAEKFVGRMHREGLPIARLWKSESALLSIGLNKRGKPGVWFTKTLR